MSYVPVMSGGRLVVLDRWGRDVKCFPLRAGSASIGSDPSCDVRVLSPAALTLHATLAVRPAGAVLRSYGQTSVNGARVSVAALRHGDTLTLAGRRLRWDYDRPDRHRRAASPAPPLTTAAPARSPGRGRRRSEPARRPAVHSLHRDSAPASAGRKQVAIVQPQRRDASDNNESPEGSSVSSGPSPRGRRPDDAHVGIRKSGQSKSPKPLGSDDTTKATLWIESRKSRSPRNSPKPSQEPPPRNSQRNACKPGESPRLSRKRSSTAPTVSPRSVSKVPRLSARGTPRVSTKSAPLRLAVLKRAHSAQYRVTKIQAPLKIDHTKQAAIMLMTGHSPRPHARGLSSPSPSPHSPRVLNVRETPSITPRRAAAYRTPTGKVKETVKKTSSGGRRAASYDVRSPTFASPKKSAMKDPKKKKNLRKTESIKFDLSNLDNCSNLSNLENEERHINSDIILVESVDDRSQDSVAEDDLTLRYSDTSSTKSPSPKKIIHSRSSRIIEKTLGSPMTTTVSESSALTKQSPRSKKSFRGSIIVQKALDESNSRYSSRTTKSISDESYSTTITSLMTDGLSPSSHRDIETYSIVDLVTIDSNGSGSSIYNSVGSDSKASFGTPRTVATRRTRSTNPSLLGSSTPYTKKTNNREVTDKTASITSSTSKRSTSITTPENTQNISFNSTRKSRASRSRSRINDSDVLLVVEDENEDSSPKSSRRSNRSMLSPIVRKNISITVSPSDSPTPGTITPENRYSPQDVGTPILSIQSLLEQSAVDQTSKSLKNFNKSKRKTTGALFTRPRTSRLSVKSKSLNLTQRRSLRARRASWISFNAIGTSQDAEQATTPKSAVKLIQEGVKNKHSTAKKPQSKRSLIDDLDDSDLVKELFNSPVKRKLSQSMTEFSKKQLFDDDVLPAKQTRNTIAGAGRTPDGSFIDQSQAITPELFVSPLSTPSDSPNLVGIKRLFARNTPDNDLRNVRGVKNILRTPRARKSINNDLCNVSGVKKIFGKSPRNRLSDVRVKEVFAQSPNDDLRRISGVKTLFQTSTNALEDVRGVKDLYRKSPRNDLRDISGVKNTMRANSPRNNLSDMRGVKQLYREQYSRNNISDVSGVEELFHESETLDTTFDQLLGRPRVREYTKANSCSKIDKRKKNQTRSAKSLHDSIGPITDNVEAWLESELKKRARATETEASKSARELRKLTIDTVEGRTPLASSRSRNSMSIKEQSGGRQKSASELYSARKLPIKKRSLVARDDSAGGDSRPGGELLPLKKRPVLHSTPVKGREHTLNASELGRVSPIALDDTRTLQSNTEAPNPKNLRVRLPQAAEEDLGKASTKRTRFKGGSSAPSQRQVAAEKREVMSPKVVRSTRQKKHVVGTPKKTRARVVEVTVVVTKPSPVKKQIKRQRSDKNKPANIEEEKPKRTRNANLKKETLKETKSTKVVKNNINETKTKKAKRSVEVKESVQVETTGPKRRRKAAPENNAKVENEAVEGPVRRRGRKPKDTGSERVTRNIKRTLKEQCSDTENVPKKSTRNRKVTAVDTDRDTKGKKVVIVAPSSRTRKRSEKKVEHSDGDTGVRRSRRGIKDIDDTKKSDAKTNEQKETRDKKTTTRRAAESDGEKRGRTTRSTVAGDGNKHDTKKKAAAPGQEPRRKRHAGQDDTREEPSVGSKRRRAARVAASVPESSRRC
ncbi:serine/arginine repetitive matrix protein 2-like isoform X1 [Danaus plexippus]|uniref:serine/arginine repetitive matrix protein 2-like isoform X1 n=2 Tax=Danaus plexippus TaxID=13037 RepID=UPI002AAFCE01|nr:serine/arginine repetitive matrix protein 2-like isoform X1 [Danaus plexippus]